MSLTQIPATIDGDIVILAPSSEVIFTATSNCYLFINTPNVEISKNGVNWFKFVTNTPAQVKEGAYLYIRSLDSVNTYNIEIIDEIYNPPSGDNNPVVGVGYFIKIEEDNKVGYGIFEVDRSNKYSTGHGAVDLSYVLSGSFNGFGSSISSQDGYGASNDYSYTRGINVSAMGYASKAEGYGSVARGHLATAGGFFTIANNNYMFASGSYNVGTNLNTIFEIGIGTSNTARANALEVYTDGRIIAPNLSTSKIIHDRSLITKEYFLANVGGATVGGELIKIDEGSGFGWVLAGRTPDNYAVVGMGAIDLSYSDVISTVNGASGARSFTTGVNTIANATLSQAHGLNVKASNAYMFAYGRYNVGESNDTIHEVGIGQSDTNRVNGFELYTNGRVVAPALTKDIIFAASDRVLITKEYLNSTTIELNEFQLISEVNQTQFDVANTNFTKEQCDVYVDGFRQSKNTYTVTTINTFTRIEFTTGKTELSVVDVVLFSLLTYETPPAG